MAGREFTVTRRYAAQPRRPRWRRGRSRRDRHVEAFHAAGQRNADDAVAGLAGEPPQPRAFRTEHPGDRHRRDPPSWSASPPASAPSTHTSRSLSSRIVRAQGW